MHFAQAELATKGMGIGTAGHGQPQSRAAYAKIGTAAAQSKSKNKCNAFNIRQFMLAWFAVAATQVAARTGEPALAIRVVSSRWNSIRLRGGWGAR